MENKLKNEDDIQLVLECEKTTEYGFNKQLGYHKPNWYGHKLGICIGILDSDENIEEVYVPKNKNASKKEVLKAMIDDPEVTIEKQKHQKLVEKDGKSTLVPYYALYLIYQVFEHPAYIPTVESKCPCLPENLNFNGQQHYEQEYIVVFSFVDDSFSDGVTTAHLPVRFSLKDRGLMGAIKKADKYPTEVFENYLVSDPEGYEYRDDEWDEDRDDDSVHNKGVYLYNSIGEPFFVRIHSLMRHLVDARVAYIDPVRKEKKINGN